MNCLPWPLLFGLAALLLPAAAFAAPAPHAPPFTEMALPTPPQQNSPWATPAGLPGPLISAATTLFDQGLADPRGGDYRKISVGIGNPWSGDSGVFETHGWALPGAAGGPRFAVCWNGLVYPVVSVGDRADLSADVDTLVQTDAKVRAAWAKANPTEPYFRFLQGAIPEGQSVSETSLLPIKACLLLRLGQGSLAQKFWDAWLGGTPPRHNNNDEILRDPYRQIADEWVWAQFDRALTAHMRGDDHLSLEDARRLTALQPLIEAEAKRRGYPQTPAIGDQSSPQPYFPYLDPLPRLLADEHRRVAETTPRPALADILAMPSKPARIAALIRALDQVAARQMGQPGGVSPDADPLVLALVAQGEDAVQPLIETVRADPRLTRSVGFGRDFHQGRSLLSTAGAAYAALVDILHTSEFSASPMDFRDHAKIAAALQAYWDKYKGLSVAERWYRVLADDGASPAQWLDAAHEIIRPGDEQVRGGWIEYPTVRRAGVPPQGEALRRGHTPSVAVLMARRVHALVAYTHAPDNDSRQLIDMQNATTLALYLTAWDAPSARPILKEQFATEHKTLERWHTYLDAYNIFLDMPKLTLARMECGDPAALGDYTDWLQSTDLSAIPGFNITQLLEPLWRAPDDPAAQRTAAFLFSAPRSPWVPLVKERPGGSMEMYEDLLDGPLLRLAAFRREMLTALTDRAVIKTVTLGGPGMLGSFFSAGEERDPFRPAVPQPFPVRRCDLYAENLSHLSGMPAFAYDWPVAQKDAAIAAAAARLRRYGASFTPDIPPILPGILPGEGGSPPPAPPILRFPRLTHPATPQDVAQNRAIFALAPGARVVSLPTYPMAAQWVTDRRYPRRVGLWSAARKKFEPGVGYSQDGHVWQAEEAADRRRFYGFVGPHDIARIPAEDMEFPPPPYIWAPVADGLDGGLGDAAGNPLGYLISPRSEGPFSITLRLRSRRGLAQTVPADFLRKHLTLTLLFSPDDPATPLTPGDPSRTWTALPPRRPLPLPPAQARRLEPTQDFAAWTVDPRGFYDLSQPGTYRLQFHFAGRPTASGDPAPEAAFRVTR